jgi:DNA-binding MarR family transcriptional regulator
VTLPNLNHSEEMSADKPADPADRPADPADKHKGLNARQKEILNKMEYGVEYSAAELAEILGIKGSRTRELLNDLVDKGFLNKTAETNRRRYLKVPLDK